MDYKYTRNSLAKKLNIGIETLRYYEKINLIQLPDRDKNGYREYSEDYFYMLKFILKAKKYGFSLKEIKKFFILLNNNQTNKSDIKLVLENKIKDIEFQIIELNALRDLLLHLYQSDNIGECDDFKDLLRR